MVIFIRYLTVNLNTKVHVMCENLWDRPKCFDAYYKSHCILFWYLLSSSQYRCRRTSLEGWWLKLSDFTAGGVGLIPGRWTKILHATLCSQKKKKVLFPGTVTVTITRWRPSGLTVKQGALKSFWLRVSSPRARWSHRWGWLGLQGTA